MSPETTSSQFSMEEIDDVESYILSIEEEGSLPYDRYSRVFDLVQRGNRAFRESHFEEAINIYSRANSIKPSDPIILGNRSSAYIRISRFQKQRPPSTSEYRPLNGLDPTTHAELGLKDAEKLLNLRSNSVKSYLLKANALILVYLQVGDVLAILLQGDFVLSCGQELERFEMARDVILSGLQVDPFSNSLQNLEITTAGLIRRRGNRKPECSDDFDCTVCLKLFYEPITTPCGHSFCRSCLFQSMDHGNKCPLCRTVLFISPRTCAVSVALNSIIQKNFPEEFAERKSEHDNLTNFGVDLMPLFVMDVVIPCQKFQLLIFEPHYKLMVRRIIEGNHRMGMVIIDPTTNSIADFACEVEIIECEPLLDGRFVLGIESRRRFRILRSWDQDGYHVAEIEWIQDIYPEGAEERADLQDLTNNATEYARLWLRREIELALEDRRRLEKLLNMEAMMPTSQDPERFSFWLATLTDEQRASERLELLRIRDTRERIRRGMKALREEEQGGCGLQ